MCPEDSILSAYFDGELNTHWETKISAHVTGCESCRSKLDEFGSVSRALKKLPSPAVKQKMHSSWQHIINRCSWDGGVSVWTRRLQIPTFLVAAAAVCFLLISAGLAYKLISNGRQLPVEANYTAELNGIDFQAIDEVMKFLNAKESGVVITFTLPVDPEFTISFGEPQLLRAADYRRGQ